jgi:hypothetical protein
MAALPLDGEQDAQLPKSTMAINRSARGCNNRTVIVASALLLTFFLSLAGSIDPTRAATAVDPSGDGGNPSREQTINSIVGVSASEAMAGSPASSDAAGTTNGASTAGRYVRSVTTIFMNLGRSTLTKVSDSLAHGCWDSVPGTVKPMHAIRIVSYSCGLFTGTEGSVTYRNEQNVRFTIYWNNPYIGSNGYSVSSTSGDYKMAYTGGPETIRPSRFS